MGTITITAGTKKNYWYTNVESFCSGAWGAGNNAGYYMQGYVMLEGVLIPKNAVITSAILTCYCATGLGYTTATLIYGNDIDNSVRPTTTAEGIALTRTTASTDPDNVTYNTTKDLNVKSIVEEITSRAGWARGNNMGFINQDVGSAENNYYLHSTTTLTVVGPSIGVLGHNIMIF